MNETPAVSLEPKPPEDLSEDEQEARQTGEPLAAVEKRNAKPTTAKKPAKKGAKKGVKKSPKAQEPAKAGQKPSPKVKPSRSKKNTPAIAHKRRARGERKAPTGRKKKVERTAAPKRGLTRGGLPVKRPNALGKTGAQGYAEPARNAPDGGKLGRAIARARKAAGLTQRDLAKLVKMTQPAICNVEKGTVGAGVEITARLCKALKLKTS